MYINEFFWSTCLFSIGLKFTKRQAASMVLVVCHGWPSSVSTGNLQLWQTSRSPAPRLPVFHGKTPNPARVGSEEMVRGAEWAATGFANCNALSYTSGGAYFWIKKCAACRFASKLRKGLQCLENNGVWKAACASRERGIEDKKGARKTREPVAKVQREQVDLEDWWSVRDQAALDLPLTDGGMLTSAFIHDRRSRIKELPVMALIQTIWRRRSAASQGKASKAKSPTAVSLQTLSKSDCLHFVLRILYRGGNIYPTTKTKDK